MGRIDAQLVAQRLREVVADEPKAFAYGYVLVVPSSSRLKDFNDRPPVLQCPWTIRNN